MVGDDIREVRERLHPFWWRELCGGKYPFWDGSEMRIRVRFREMCSEESRKFGFSIAVFDDWRNGTMGFCEGFSHTHDWR